MVCATCLPPSAQLTIEVQPDLKQAVIYLGCALKTDEACASLRSLEQVCQHQLL